LAQTCVEQLPRQTVNWNWFEGLEVKRMSTW
jgi:hypothetical protein